jgi:hypothetical protein
MHGICFDFPLQDWFDFKIPRTSIKKDFIQNCLTTDEHFNTKPTAKVIWLGGKPTTTSYTKSKRGQTWDLLKMTFHDKKESFEINLDQEKGLWLAQTLEKLSAQQENPLNFEQLKTNFEQQFDDFELFWYAKPINTLRNYGLLVL